MTDPDHRGPPDGKARLDAELVRRGLVRSRAQARQLVTCGAVLVDGATATKPSTPVSAANAIVLAEEPDRWVGRAAYKLLEALRLFGEDGLTVVGKRCLDVGASTGGFTQVLLERGCREVIAVDVGTDQLAAQLRDDPRVRSLQQTNLRDLTLAHLDDKPVDLAVADVSFISLTLLVGPLLGVTAADGELLLLVKPQFEVGRERLGSGGVVRDEGLRRQGVDGVVASAGLHGWSSAAVVPSRIQGASGNTELFVLLRRRER